MASFWRLQFAGWLAYGVAMYLASAREIGVQEALLHKVPFVVLGFAITLALRQLYRRLDRLELPFPRLVLVSIAASFAFAQIWAVLFNATKAALLDVSLSEVGGPLKNSLHLTFVFVSWSALYFSVRHHLALRRESQQVLDAKHEALEARQRMLRYQVHPHFLFNTLNSLHGLIREDPARAEEMLDAISSLLREMLEGARHERVALRQEVAALRSYPAIEKIRFEEKLEVTLDVDADVADVDIPVFLLHPLVENAVKHGLSTSHGPVRVAVRAHRNNGQVQIEVANTGRLELGNGDGAGAVRSTGTGLTNVRNRLDQLYPRRHRFEVRQDGAWVRARMELPLQLAGVES